MKPSIPCLLFAVVISSCGGGKEEKEEQAPAAGSKTYLDIPDNSIINIYDAFGKVSHGLRKDFGFSAIIKANGMTILFDGGTNADVFRENIEKLKIDLTQVDFAVASGTHFGHINGFDYLLEVKPDVKIYFPGDIYFGAPFPLVIRGTDPEVAEALDEDSRYFEGRVDSFQQNQSGRFWKANVEYVRKSMEIAPGINLIATASADYGYFGKGRGGAREETGLPELSLSIKTKSGEALLVGCSNTPVEQIVKAAKEQLKSEIYLLYGGYHLINSGSDEIIELATRLRDEHGVDRVAPAHCTGHLAFKIFKYVYRNNYIFAGLGETTRLGEE